MNSFGIVIYYAILSFRKLNLDEMKTKSREKDKEGRFLGQGEKLGALIHNDDKLY